MAPAGYSPPVGLLMETELRSRAPEICLYGPWPETFRPHSGLPHQDDKKRNTRNTGIIRMTSPVDFL